MTSTAGAIQGLASRHIWVRDGYHDPAGIVNPLLQGLLTQAVQDHLSPTLAPLVSVQLDPPACALGTPRMRDMPDTVLGEGREEVSWGAATISGHHSGVPQPQQPGASTPVPTGEGGAQSTGGRALTPPVHGSQTAGDQEVVHRSSTPESIHRGAAVCPSTPPGYSVEGMPAFCPAVREGTAVTTATQLKMAGMSKYSVSVLLRNRMRMKAAQLGTATQHQVLNTRDGPPGIVVPATQLQEADVLCITVAAHTRLQSDHDRATASSPPPQHPASPPPPPALSVTSPHAAAGLGKPNRAGSATSSGKGGERAIVDGSKRHSHSKPHGRAAPGSTKQSQQQWLVPAFNSVTGYEYGLYLEDQETVIFD
jgi:hypothetical protein